MLDMATQKSFQERLTTIRTLKKESLLTDSEKISLSLKDAKPSCFFEYQGSTYFIKEINPYQETSQDYSSKKEYFIYELVCLCLKTGKTMMFEWEYDDELEISMTQDKYSFKDLKDDDGQAIDEDDLDQIADDKDVVVLNNETFQYEDDWAAVYSRNSKEENVYLYEFENDSSTRYLTIEEWQGSGRDQYQIYTSVPVNPADIRLVTKGE